MTKAVKLKIVLLGPASTGKTTIANFLSEVSEASLGDLKNTRGVRIVEFEIEDLPVKPTNLTAEIELWDCSGDRRYESCWPVFFHEADGLVLVYAKESPEQKEDLKEIFGSAAEKITGLNNNTIIFSNVFGDKETNTGSNKNVIPNINCYDINVESKGEDLKKIFNDFITEIISRKNDLT